MNDPGPATSPTAPLRIGWRDILTQAAAHAGYTVEEPTLIRDGSNTIIQLSHDIVARIGPVGSGAGARRQLAISRWLHDSGIPVVTPVEDLPQPVVVDGRPVTWWHLIPPHRHATPGELGAVLHRLHTVPVPRTPELPALDPFTGLEDAVDKAVDDAVVEHGVLTEQDRTWLRQRIASLRDAYTALLPQLETGVIHGDAWQGNLLVPDQGGDPVLIDLDHVAIGPRDWDLVPVAVDYTDFARISTADYQDFVAAVGGHDVTRSPAFAVLAAITEITWTAFTIRKACDDARLGAEVRHRMDCLNGRVAKPWTWNAS